MIHPNFGKTRHAADRIEERAIDPRLVAAAAAMPPWRTDVDLRTGCAVSVHRLIRSRSPVAIPANLIVCVSADGAVITAYWACGVGPGLKGAPRRQVTGPRGGAS